MTTDQSIEDEIQAKGLTAPRVTLADVQENVVDTEIHKHVTKSGQVLRWAILTMRSGFAVVGNPSCAVSSANDNEDLGTKVALQNSLSALWPLMGYALSEKLAAADLTGAAAPVASTFQDRVRAERAELAGKVDKLGDFLASPGAGEIDLGELVRLTNQSRIMQDYLAVLDQRIAFFDAPNQGESVSD